MTASWHKLVPLGEFPHPSGVVQVIDRHSVDAMSRSFQPERRLLVDFDHYSDLSGADRAVLDERGIQLPSAAAGWIASLEPREDGLWGQIDWTEPGAAALLNKTYRFLSPVWLRSQCETVADGKLRPVALAKVGLTNEPNIRAIPALLNRAGEDRLSGPEVLLNSEVATPVPPAPADSGTTSPGQTGRKESTMDFKAELLALLGLNADATDEQISAAVAAKKAKDAETGAKAEECEAMTNRATAAEAKVAAFESAALAAQVEEDLARNAGKILNRDQWKKALLANRAAALELLEALPEPSQRILNRSEARTPQSLEGDARLANRRAEQIAFVNRIANECAISFTAAWPVAAQRNPELFTE